MSIGRKTQSIKMLNLVNFLVAQTWLKSHPMLGQGPLKKAKINCHCMRSKLWLKLRINPNPINLRKAPKIIGCIR